MKKLFLSGLLALSLFFILTFAGVICIRTAYPIQYREIANKYCEDWRLVLSIIKAESNFDKNAVSEAGACGLMQLMPGTAAFIAAEHNITSYDLFVAEDNIRLGCLYLQYLQNKFADRTAYLAAYNAGEGNVAAWLQDAQYSSDGVFLEKIPFEETKNYVKKIKKYYANYMRFYLTNESKSCNIIYA